MGVEKTNVKQQAIIYGITKCIALFLSHCNGINRWFITRRGCVKKVTSQRYSRIFRNVLQIYETIKTVGNDDLIFLYNYFCIYTPGNVCAVQWRLLSIV